MCYLRVHAPLPFPFQHQSVVNELGIINSGLIMAKLKITTIPVGQVMLNEEGYLLPTIARKVTKITLISPLAGHTSSHVKNSTL